jgi:glycosyltransferase Alg8
MIRPGGSAFPMSAAAPGLPVVTAAALLRPPGTQTPAAPDRRQTAALAVLMVAAMAASGHLIAQEGLAAAAVPVGLYAAWRYLWWMTHLLRALLFLKRRFPRLRRAADRAAQGRGISRLYVVVTSYNIAPQTFAAVYRALFAAAAGTGVPVTVIASVTSARDRALLQDVHEQAGAPPMVEVVVQFQKGDGKRGALAAALRAIARRCPEPDSLTALLDGDILLEPAALRRCLPFFLADPALAALTTNNDAVVRGGALAADWYALRHAQRHLLMSSLALSGRLLVLTGRFSVYRTAEATEPGFIGILERDAIDHWRLGRIDFLSGDDKSVWFHLLRRRRRMLYVPDVTACGVEALPAGASFVTGTTRLMVRWFGNMLRTNGRAIALGPAVTTPFLWWCLVDQRLSVWSSLVGPAVAVLAALAAGPAPLVHYLLWACATRSAMALALGALWGRSRVLWPVLMMWNQIWGALLKGWVAHRPDRQSWTRQGLRSRASATVTARLAGELIHLASALLFLGAAGLVAGLFSRALLQGALP